MMSDTRAARPIVQKPSVNAMRGIRFIDGPDGATPAAPTPQAPTPAAPTTSTATEPTDPPENETPAQELERLKRESRKWETRAKENKEAADAWQAHQQSQKTDDEKRREQELALASENAALKAQVLRGQVAEEKGVPASLLTGSTREEIEASAEQLIKFKGTTPTTDPTPTPATFVIHDEQGLPAIGKDAPTLTGMESLRAAYAQPAQ